jgi:ribonuclease-3 family protein
MVQYNGVTLAYIGDAVYELYIRETLIKNGLTKVDSLHQEAIKYTSANGQKAALDVIYESLTEEEISIFKRGRNASTMRKARNADLSVYKQATGFEALIGYLHITQNFERLHEIMSIIIK